jgi:hypothetical protein
MSALTHRALVLTFIFALCAIPACGSDNTESADTGTLVFVMNGEDFACNSFVSEDGYTIDFSHVWATVSGPTAFQVVVEDDSTDPENNARLKPQDLRAHAGHPHADIADGQAHQALIGQFTRDLHDATGPVEIGRVEDIEIGNYNYLNFDLEPATEESDGALEDALGYSLMLVGTAEKDGETLPFTIALTERLSFVGCGPHHDNIGIVDVGTTGTAEITFHLDHLFGDASEGPADPDDPDTVNAVAVGFGWFAQLVQNGELWATQSDLSTLDGYDAFMAAFQTIGHSGEGHCGLAED